MHRNPAPLNYGPMHPYEADPQSGAGNCTCGGAECHRRHPHDFRRAWSPFKASASDYCVCGQLPEAPCHFTGFALPTSKGSPDA